MFKLFIIAHNYILNEDTATFYEKVVVFFMYEDDLELDSTRRLVAVRTTRIHTACTETRLHVVHDMDEYQQRVVEKAEKCGLNVRDVLREMKNVSAIRNRALQHILAFGEYKYAYTLSTTSKELKDSPSEFKQVVKDFLRTQNVKSAFVLEESKTVEETATNPDSVIGLHIHGLSDKPIDLSDWKNYATCDEKRLYCEEIVDLEKYVKYMLKNLKRTHKVMPKGISMIGYVGIRSEIEGRTQTFIYDDGTFEVIENSRAKAIRLENEKKERKERILQAFKNVIEKRKNGLPFFGKNTSKKTSFYNASNAKTTNKRTDKRTSFYRRI